MNKDELEIKSMQADIDIKQAQGALINAQCRRTIAEAANIEQVTKQAQSENRKLATGENDNGN